MVCLGFWSLAGTSSGRAPTLALREEPWTKEQLAVRSSVQWVKKAEESTGDCREKDQEGKGVD